MIKQLLILFILVCTAATLPAQVKLYEDQFNGGVTGGSFSTGVQGLGSGVGGPGSSPDNSMWAWILVYGNSNVLPTAVFSSPNHICPGTCTDFTNLSHNATSFLWNFPGGNPAVSTNVNPASICYNTPGQYNVELIATNSNGSDTLKLPNYITVIPFPAPQGILQNGDTLFANAGASSYQWYHDGNLIPGATGYYYIATENGNYNVVATDENDCEVEAVIFDVVAGIKWAVGPDSYREQLEIYPNPVSEKLFVSCNTLTAAQVSFSVYNVLGEKVKSISSLTLENHPVEIDCRELTPGIYTLELVTDLEHYHSQFIMKY